MQLRVARPWHLLVVLLVVVAACTDNGTSSSPASGSAGPLGSGRTNVVFVLTDDMRIDDLQFMPQVRSLIGDQGMTFDDYFDNVTLCCPARTSILRGQYSHHTGVLTNGGTNGGFETAHARDVEQSTIATAMHDAGYITGLFGKYLNGYPRTVDDSYVPPGWDHWSSATKGNAYSEYDYTLNQDGTQVAYGHGPDDYGTDVYVRQTKDFIKGAVQASKPFFAYLAVYAPHQPATPAPQDADAFTGLQAPRDGSFDEADVNDKPQYIQALPQLGPARQTQIDDLYRRRAQSLQAVDRGVASLVDELRSDGVLDDTVIVFTSDNGFHLGQHRLPAGKQTAYETDIHLPLLVRGPGIAPGSHASALVGNVDLGPTIAALGGASMTDDPDGRSLLPLLADPHAAATDWRQVYLLEHWTETSTGQVDTGDGQVEPDDLDQSDSTASTADATASTTARQSRAGGTRIPEYQGLRAAGYTYVEYVTGERELYDLTHDPDELQNLAGTASTALLDAFHQRLDALRDCTGDGCRRAESEPLQLPG